MVSARDQRTGRKVASLSVQYRPNFWGLLLIPIHGTILAFEMLQQSRGGGSFKEGVLLPKGQEMVSA